MKAEERIVRLESIVRRQRQLAWFGIVLLLIAGTLGAAKSSQDTITVRKITIVSSSGKPVVVIDGDSASSVLNIIGDDGVSSIQFGIDKSGSVLMLSGPRNSLPGQSKPKTALRLTQDTVEIGFPSRITGGRPDDAMYLTPLVRLGILPTVPESDLHGFVSLWGRERVPEETVTIEDFPHELTTRNMGGLETVTLEATPTGGRLAISDEESKPLIRLSGDRLPTSLPGSSSRGTLQLDETGFVTTYIGASGLSVHVKNDHRLLAAIIGNLLAEGGTMRLLDYTKPYKDLETCLGHGCR